MILIAEDNVLIGMMMEDDLRQAGFETAGPAATNAAALALADESEISLALVDVDLANGDSGFDLAAALSERHSIPCVFSTGQAMDAMSNAGTALGVLRKPFSGPQLVAAVETAVRIAEDAGYVPCVDEEHAPVTWFKGTHG